MVAVVAALVAVSVLVFGGFRLSTLAGRLSVTDWTRPALWSLAAAALRHAIVRRAPLPARVAAGVRAWWRHPDTHVVLPVHLATRGSVLFVGFVAVILIGFPPEAQSRWSVYRNVFFDLPARWDAGWYLGIAIDGYHFDPQAREGLQQNVAFFPAYPMLMRVISPLMGRQTLWAGVAVSLVSFYLALLYLLRLARHELASEDAAIRSVTLLAAYPFAVYFSTAYTEALFLLASVAAVYHFRRDEWWRAAAWGFAAGLTRPNGCLLSIPLGLMALEPLWRTGGLGWRPAMVRLASASAPGLGMLAFSAFIYSLTGNALAWAAQNAAWGRVYRGLGAIVSDRVAYLAEYGLYGYASTQTIDMLYLLAVLFVLGAVWPVYRRLGVPYAALILVNVLPPMAAGGLLSIGRVTSVLFPAFLWMGAVVPSRHHAAWVAAFAGLQGLVAAMFFTWRPMF